MRENTFYYLNPKYLISNKVETIRLGTKIEGIGHLSTLFQTTMSYSNQIVRVSYRDTKDV